MNESNDRIVKILKNAGRFFFATVDDGVPFVRPFNAVVEFDGKVYFYTNNHKSAYAQMVKNPMVELCAEIDEDRWIRVSGKVVFDYNPEVKVAMLNANPKLRETYNEEDKIFEVFYLSNMSAKIHSLHAAPEVIC
ncbi:MAG: pyridoxamine 5'-phosphate oxidase family protein [Clostridia bacterium]|nr:pyridoxamine 5'-phosphate oxidase family protein [Clostridia bacterium]